MNSERKEDFTFIDLFSGIGGLRLAFEQAGGKCVLGLDCDKLAQKTYVSNFSQNRFVCKSITDIYARDVPCHDVLLAGFPCQPFSRGRALQINSVSRPGGFEDKTYGTLFFDIARIIREKKPQAFVLENVKNLRHHDNGNTFRIIWNVLTQDLGYTCSYRVMDGQSWVPQHRERIVIVGFRKKIDFSLETMEVPPKGKIRLSSILHKTDGTEPIIPHDGSKYFDYDKNKVLDRYTLSDRSWSYLQERSQKQRLMKNGFSYGLVTENDISRTLVSSYYTDGEEILVSQGTDKNPRRLTPRECARLMGFPDTFVIPVSNTRAYKQFGNSVVVPMFRAVADFMKPFIVREADR